MEYNATVTVDATTRDKEATDQVLDDLVGLSPAIGWNDAGQMVVTITVRGDDLGRGASVAVNAVRVATHASPLAVEVVPTADYDARRRPLDISA